MARDYYSRTIAQASGVGAISALAGVEVHVYLPGTTTHAQIYTTASGSEQQANPYITDATGFVEFWADVGRYDIYVIDQQVPPRIGADTYYWNALSAEAGSIPTNRLVPDDGIGLSMVGADIERQFVPIGAVLDWWRPSTAVPVPSGFEICDGRIIADGQHSFGIAGAITLPDLRNVFILGADTPTENRTQASGRSSDLGGAYVGETTAAVAGNTGANAPGIRGAGGSNANISIAHTHNVPAHSHGKGNLGINDPGHSHVFQGEQFAPGGATAGPYFRTGAGLDATYGATSTDDANISLSGSYVGNNNGNNGDSGFNTGAASTASFDFRPRYFGLLRIMKVRRS